MSLSRPQRSFYQEETVARSNDTVGKLISHTHSTSHATYSQNAESRNLNNGCR